MPSEADPRLAHSHLPVSSHGRPSTCLCVLTGPLTKTQVILDHNQPSLMTSFILMTILNTLSEVLGARTSMCRFCGKDPCIREGF